ncbi:MAG: hypothetical protein QFX36_03845 [Archaeoglobales archaeon]|nr:hypothetical protein [Archaeoglobales archaeon]
MGVYHVAGLGKNPGALTVPLSIVYILQAAQALGVEEAQEFFKFSGEMERKGSYEKTKGGVECVIAFTSREVIEGEIFEFNSNWFDLNFPKNKKIKLKEVYEKFFKKLFNHLSEQFPELELKKFDLFLVEVKYTDFEDCFKKVGITLRALRDKELWGNIIGGSNQLNIAILTAGAYTETISRYYYVFQKTTNILEPEWAKKPNRKNIKELARESIDRWYELPIFSIRVGDILKKIEDVFEGREKANKKEIENVIKDFGLTNQFLAKLQGIGILKFNRDVVEKGYRFEKLLSIWKEVDKFSDVDNFSNWKNWAKKEGVLHEIKLFES